LDKFVIHGGHRLTGEIEVSGAKNAAVALIPAVLLSDEPCVLENVPDISDVSISLQIMSEMGATVEYLTKTTVRISAAGLTNYCVPYESARKMRASYYFLGALLGRYGKARVSMPGGCPLGDRPIDQHLKAFAALGAKCNIEHGMVDLVADQLTGNQIYLDVVSVGATMNAMLAAVRAKGLTVIENAAKEPHIVDLANFLNSMGAEIMGAGTDVIKIRGVERLHGAVYSVIPDQIEAGTFMIAAAATKGDVLVTNVIPKHLEPITSKMRKIGVNIEEFDDSGMGRRSAGAYQRQDHAAPRLPHRYAAADHHPADTGRGYQHHHRGCLGTAIPLCGRTPPHGCRYFRGRQGCCSRGYRKAYRCTGESL